MRKLFITCSCGQQMQVPRSAIGKMGQCPTCGEKIPITRDTTSRTRRSSMAMGSVNRSNWGGVGPSIEAKQRFGRAVDLYCAGKYGEALVIFNGLYQEFPESPEIAKARQQCIEARTRDPLNLPGPASGQVLGDELDEETLRTMRRIAVEKMLHGTTDSVQLQAAELVARLAGVLDPGPKAPETGSGSESTASGNVASANGKAAKGNGRGHDPGAKNQVSERDLDEVDR